MSPMSTDFTTEHAVLIGDTDAAGAPRTRTATRTRTRTRTGTAQLETARQPLARSTLYGKMRGGMGRYLASSIAMVSLLAAAPTARADLEGMLVVSPGGMIGFASDGGRRFDGELSVTYYRRIFGLGLATGGNPDRFYAELQPVAVLYPSGPPQRDE